MTFKFLPKDYEQIEERTGAKVYPNIITAPSFNVAVATLYGCDPMYVMSNGKGFYDEEFTFEEIK